MLDKKIVFVDLGDLTLIEIMIYFKKIKQLINSKYDLTEEMYLSEKEKIKKLSIRNKIINWFKFL